MGFAKLILLIAWIVGAANGAFAFERTGHSNGDKVTRAVWRDKANDDSGDYKLNKGYSSAYNVKDDRVGKGFARRDYKDDETIDNEYDKLAGKLKRGNYHGGKGFVGYGGPKGDGHRESDQASDTKFDDGYNRKYQHGYHHSHGYRHSHRHRSGDEDEDGSGDKYGDGYHRFRMVHDREEKSSSNRDRCRYGACKFAGYYRDDGLEYRQENNGRDHDERNYNRGGRDEYKDNSEHNGEENLGHDRNGDIDDHRQDYHYGYAESGSNYGKDYPGFGRERLYSGQGAEQDAGDHPGHGLVRRDYWSN